MDSQKLDQIVIGLALQALGKAEERGCVPSVLVRDIVDASIYASHHEDALEILSAISHYHPNTYDYAIYQFDLRSYKPCFTIAAKCIALYALIDLVQTKIGTIRNAINKEC
jgi:hypothetical protein